MVKSKLPLPVRLIPNASWLLSHHAGFDYQPYFPDDSKIDTETMRRDLDCCVGHIIEFSGSKDTMAHYRTEANRFLSWLWLIRGIGLFEVKRHDVIEYLDFCLYPPASWSDDKTSYCFIYDRLEPPKQNPHWKPFNSVNKSSQSAITTIFTRLSSLFSSARIFEAIGHNPVQSIRQKSKFRKKRVGFYDPKVITPEQINYCLETCEDWSHNAQTDKEVFAAERALFAFSLGLGLYLRASEFVVTDHHTPTHGDFWKDSLGNWWLYTVGKGNKSRSIAVSDDVLDALQRYRDVLELAPLPLKGDTTPLFIRLNSDTWCEDKGRVKRLEAVTDTVTVWKTMKHVFDMARRRMVEDGLEEDAMELLMASPHWLRHTAISNEVEYRSLEDVRDDAGHSSIKTTWRYVQATNRERAKSKKIKSLR